MLTLASARPAPGHRDLLLFSDDADAGVHYLLPVALRAAGDGTLTVMGRGSRRRAGGILGGFWTLPLCGTVPDDAARRALAATLAPPGAAPPRLSIAEAVLDLRLTLAGDVTAETRSEGWHGGTVALNGELPAGEAAAALVEAWQDGLPDAVADLTLTLAGMGEPAELTLTDNRLRSAAGAAGRTVESRSRHVTASRQQAATLTIHHRHPLRLPRRATGDGIVWAGFDPQ